MPRSNASVGLGHSGVSGSMDKRFLGSIKMSDSDMHTQHGLLGLSDVRAPQQSHLRTSQPSTTRSIPSFLLAASESPGSGRSSGFVAGVLREDDVGSNRIFGLRPPQRSARGKGFLQVPSVEDGLRRRRGARTSGPGSDDRNGCNTGTNRRPGASRAAINKDHMGATGTLLLGLSIRLWKLSKGIVGAPFAVLLKALLSFLRSWSFFLKVWLWVVWVAVRIVKELLDLIGPGSMKAEDYPGSAKGFVRDSMRACPCEECASGKLLPSLSCTYGSPLL